MTAYFAHIELNLLCRFKYIMQSGASIPTSRPDPVAAKKKEKKNIRDREFHNFGRP